MFLIKGQVVYKKLKERSNRFTTIRGLVQTEESKQLIGGGDDVFVGDIRQPDSILPAIQGIDAIIILTSSTPKVLPGPNSIISSFGFEPGASPEEVVNSLFYVIDSFSLVFPMINQIMPLARLITMDKKTN